MTNYQINRLEKTLAKSKITQTCAVLAGEDSGFSYMIENYSPATNETHRWFTLNTAVSGEMYGKTMIYSAFLPSGKITELLAFLNIPATNPNR